MKKNYNKYTGFLDRFPYVIVAVIIVIAIIFVLIFRAKFTTLFSSSTTSQQQTQNTALQTKQYPMLISSPANNQVYSFADKNGTVPIKIELKEDIGNTNYKLNLVLGDGQTIKTFTAAPYEYAWNPGSAADYLVVANLVDTNDNIVSSSNTVKFSVEYTSSTSNTSSSESSSTTTSAIDNSVTINLQILEGPIYSPEGDIYYYRVEAIVTGNPLPTVKFSKDDSNGVWGKTKAQVNLGKGQSYNLTATATNDYDSQIANIILTAPK